MQAAAVISRVTTADQPELVRHDIVTERLALSIVRPSDIMHYRSLMTEPAVMRYIGLDQGKIPSDAEIAAIVNGAVTAWETRGYGRWSVFDQESEDFVGFSGFRCEGGVPELISIVHERYWGNGYATEAARAVLRYGFNSLGFSVVCSFLRPENVRARALIERLGGEFVGLVDFHGVEGAAYRMRSEDLKFHN